MFPFSLQLVFDQTLNNLIVCLISRTQQKHTEVAQRVSMLQWRVGRFDWSQNEFEMSEKTNLGGTVNRFL